MNPGKEMQINLSETCHIKDKPRKVQSKNREVRTSPRNI